MPSNILSPRRNKGMYHIVCDEDSLHIPKSRHIRRLSSPWSKKKKDSTTVNNSPRQPKVIEIVRAEGSIPIIDTYADENSSLDFKSVHSKQTLNEQRAFLIHYFGLRNGLVEKVPSPANSFQELKIGSCSPGISKRPCVSSKMLGQKSAWVDFDDDHSDDTFTTCSMTDSSLENLEMNPFSFYLLSSTEEEGGSEQLFPKDSIIFEEIVQKSSCTQIISEQQNSNSTTEDKPVDPRTKIDEFLHHLKSQADVTTSQLPERNYESNSYTEDKPVDPRTKIDEFLLHLKSQVDTSTARSSDHNDVSNSYTEEDTYMKQNSNFGQDIKSQCAKNIVEFENKENLQSALKMEVIIDTNSIQKDKIQNEKSDTNETNDTSLATLYNFKKNPGIPPLYPYAKYTSSRSKNRFEEILSHKHDSDEDFPYTSSVASYDSDEFNEDDECYEFDDQRAFNGNKSGSSDSESNISSFQRDYEIMIDDCESSIESSDDEDDWKHYAYGYYMQDEVHDDIYGYGKEISYPSLSGKNFKSFIFNVQDRNEDSSEQAAHHGQYKCLPRNEPNNFADFCHNISDITLEESSNHDAYEYSSSSDCSSLYFRYDCKEDCTKRNHQVPSCDNLPEKLAIKETNVNMTDSDEESSKQKKSLSLVPQPEVIQQHNINLDSSDDGESLIGLGFINGSSQSPNCIDHLRPAIFSRKITVEDDEIDLKSNSPDCHLAMYLKLMEEDDSDLLMSDNELKQDVSNLIATFLKESKKEKGRIESVMKNLSKELSDF